MFDPHSNAVYFARYNALCTRYVLLTDQALIDRWKYHQLRSRRREDGDWIAFSEMCIRDSTLPDSYVRLLPCKPSVSGLRV